VPLVGRRKVTREELVLKIADRMMDVGKFEQAYPARICARIALELAEHSLQWAWIHHYDLTECAQPVLPPEWEDK
jgi:hypothetical protein